MINNNRYYKERDPKVLNGYVNLKLGKVKRAILFNLRELSYRFRSMLVSRKHVSDSDYHQVLPFSPLLNKGNDDIVKLNLCRYFGLF